MYGGFLLFLFFVILEYFVYLFGGIVILVRVLDYFFVCGLIFGQILENIGGFLYLWVYVL